MHLEFLSEDSSGKRLLEWLVPAIIGPHGTPHTWNIHSYKGIGRLPTGLRPRTDAQKRILLDQLPKLLQGYGRTPAIDAVVVVLDSDDEDCRELRAELLDLLARCRPAPRRTLFRIAIEEVEAWYFGDRDAVLEVYPQARPAVLNAYQQDSVGYTWERFADAVYPGGYAALKAKGWPIPGETKWHWADTIGAFMDVERNVSPSFGKLRDGLRRLVAEE